MTPTCADVEPIMAELALDLLPGEERAAALAHVDGCASCRRRLVELTAAADRLVELTPAAEPPPGFEQRVLAAIAPRAPASLPARARPRRLLAVAAAVVVLALAAAGAIVVSGRSDGRQREAAMVAPDGSGVGDVYVHAGQPGWVLFSVPAWADRWGGQPYTVRVTAADGTVTDLAGGDLHAGRGAWGTSLPMPAGDVRSVALVGPDGRLWCTGTFT